MGQSCDTEKTRSKQTNTKPPHTKNHAVEGPRHSIFFTKITKKPTGDGRVPGSPGSALSGRLISGPRSLALRQRVTRVPSDRALPLARGGAPPAQGWARSLNKWLVLKEPKLPEHLMCYDLCIRHSNHPK